MIYFILSILFIIIGIILYFLIVIKKIKKLEIMNNQKLKKADDAKVLEDLRYLRAQLMKIEDPDQRIAIIKKIEIISSIYN